MAPWMSSKLLFGNEIMSLYELQSKKSKFAMSRVVLSNCDIRNIPRAITSHLKRHC